MQADVTHSDDAAYDPKDPEEFSRLVREHHRELLVYARALSKDVLTAREIVQSKLSPIFA